MIALSIRPPWSWLLVLGIKTVEIRRWKNVKIPPIDTKILIYNSRHFDVAGFKYLKTIPRVNEYIENSNFPAFLPGAIIGEGTLYRIEYYREDAEFNHHHSEHLNPIVSRDDFKGWVFGVGFITGIQFINTKHFEMSKQIFTNASIGFFKYEP